MKLVAFQTTIREAHIVVVSAVLTVLITNMGFFIKCEKTIGILFTTALGLFASVWTNCIFVINIRRNMYIDHYADKIPYEYDLILRTIQYEYLLIVGIATVALYWGVRKCRPKYLIPWACLKVCECVVLFGGTPLMFYESMKPFTGLIPFVLISLALNVYTSMCIQRVYSKMQLRVRFERYVTDISEDLETVAPPSYEASLQPGAVVVAVSEEMSRDASVGAELPSEESVGEELPRGEFRQDLDRTRQIPTVHVHQTSHNFETISS